jgi:rare lipoprotein A
MRRTIGISFACLVTSACAMSETPEESTSHYPDEATGVPQGNTEIPCCTPVRAAGSSQFGKASWYDHVGNQTASGEILDTVTPTAAHRSLPLRSYAKVTNLDSGCSVIVKINDRGPYIRGRIIDLSPRAADALDMKRAGVAAVVIEPFVDQAPPTVTAFQTAGTAVAQ